MNQKTSRTESHICTDRIGNRKLHHLETTSHTDSFNRATLHFIHIPAFSSQPIRAMTDPEKAVPSDMESVEDDDRKTNSLINRPDIMSVIQARFQTGEKTQNFPECIKRRIKALKQLQLSFFNIEAKFYEEVHALECKYNKMFSEIYEKRSTIVSGAYEPTDEECVWETDEEDENLPNDVKVKLKIENVDEKKTESEKEDVKGIPEFWLSLFKNVGMLDEMVQEHDEPILKHLNDIKVILLESDPMGFILEFHFESNEYFFNSVLTKEYVMKCAPDKNDPFSFEGPEIYKSKGCVIDWKKGKNVTVKTIKKSQKHKSHGHVRTITKTIHNDSFFNFFSPPDVPDDSDVVDLDEEIKSLLTSDFEIGHYIRERIVPRAVLYYTGECLEDEGDDYEEEECDEDDDEDDDDCDEEEDDDEERPDKNTRSDQS